MKAFLPLSGVLFLLSVTSPAWAVGSDESLTLNSQLEPQSVQQPLNPVEPADVAPINQVSQVEIPVLAQNLPVPEETIPVADLSGSALTAPSQVQPEVDQDGNPIPQVTSVSQLSDVKPTDWAYQAVQSLVEKYGCIVGYPDSTFRGNRAATRFELAAALNACLDVISDRFATKEDLAAVRKLMEEFAAELATIKGRVDNLEARAAKLEATQFSTTTKLAGEVIFQATQIGGGNIPVAAGVPKGAAGKIGDNFTVSGRATLNFLTSFTGKDLLITSLQAGNYDTDFASGPGFSALLAPQVTQSSTGNIFGVYSLQYRFPLFNDKATVIATAVGGELADFVDTLNPYLDSDGQGSLSAFGLRNPIYRQITRYIDPRFSGAGGGIIVNFTDKITFGAGYLAPLLSAADPRSQRIVTNPLTNSGDLTGGGLFGGDYAAIAQLTFKPIEKLGFGLTYVRSYTKVPFVGLSFAGYTGTNRANITFEGLRANGIDTDQVPTSSDSAGFEFSWAALKRLTISGWVGVTIARAEDSGSFVFDNNGNARTVNRGDTATILNYALTFAMPDLFKKGNLGGVVIGSQPQVISSSIRNYTDPSMNFHLEAFYRYQVNDNISITPGIFTVINPEGNSNNAPVVVGTVRTTFSF
jgi:hypothetical protein